MLNVRIGYITFPYPDICGSGLRHYPADTHLTAWLESQDIAYDVVTDFELHNEGTQVLEPYRVALTGTHPEYYTEESWKAMRDYRNGGGRFCYLGGNGFYWNIAMDDENGVLEINGNEIIGLENLANNGIVRVIDTLLVPPGIAVPGLTT